MHQVMLVTAAQRAVAARLRRRGASGASDAPHSRRAALSPPPLWSNLGLYAGANDGGTSYDDACAALARFLADAVRSMYVVSRM